MYVCEVSFSTVSIASGSEPPRRVIGTTGRPARVAIVHDAPANAVSAPALWLITITPSPSANGGRFANAIELTARASRPASCSIERAELGRVLARPGPDEPDPARVAEALGGRGRER